ELFPVQDWRGPGGRMSAASSARGTYRRTKWGAAGALAAMLVTFFATGGTSSAAPSQATIEPGQGLGIAQTSRVDPRATAACRDASDGPDFIARGERALGSAIHVLSGQREAELAAFGILMGFRAPDGFAGDLVGGSREVLEVRGEALRQSATLPLGGLRLLDASDGRIDDALEIAD